MAMATSYTTATTTGVTTVWYIWNNMTTSSSTIQPVWQAWNSASTTASNTVWFNWATTANSTSPYVAVPAAPRHVTQPTAEELQARERAREERLRREAARIAARNRAMELFRSHLRPEQLETIDKHGWFVVEGGKSKKPYRVKVNHYAGNIFELKDDKEIANYCVHANLEIPLGDHLLSQLISLRYDEDHIIGLANKRNLAT